LNIGGSSNGINALMYSIVRATTASKHRVLGAKFSIDGFIKGEVTLFKLVGYLCISFKFVGKRELNKNTCAMCTNIKSSCKIFFMKNRLLNSIGPVLLVG